MIKFKIKDLKVGDDVLFRSKKYIKIRWLGKVGEIKEKERFVYITYFSLFREKGQKEQDANFFPFEWDGYLNWMLYKLNKEELEKVNRELLLLN